MNRCIFTKRLSYLSLAAAAALFAAIVGTPAQADLLWYDGFAIGGVDDGAGPNYVAGGLAPQQGGSDAGAPGGIGFFDDVAGDPNPWLGVNNTNNADTDNVLAVGSLTRFNQSPASTGDQAADQPATGCCNTARTSRDFNTPLQDLTGTYYMGFLVNFGLGNPADPHYRAVEFWNGKSTTVLIPDPDPLNPPDPDINGNIPNPNFGRIGDDQLNMSIGVSSFGNYNLDLDGNGNGTDGNGFETANRQISVRIDGVREEFGTDVTTHHQLDEHIEFPDQFGETHSVVIKFEMNPIEVGLDGVNGGDRVSFFLDPKPTDLVEPTPSLVIPKIDLRLDSMSSIILFQFTEANPLNPGGFDELRVGTTWGDAAILGVPEPASLCLVGLGMAGMLITARRKRG